MDDIETTTTETVETKPDAGAAGEGGKDTPAPKGGNAWDAMRESIGELGKVKNLGELEPDADAEAEKGKGDEKGKEKGGKPAPKPKAAVEGEDEETDEGEDDEQTDDDEGDEKGKKPDAKKGDEKAADQARYSVVGKDGAEFEFEELPKGAKIVFKAGGQKVEITSVADLVQMAQLVPGLQKMESTYQGQVKSHQKTIKGLEGKLSAAEKAFREIVSDDEKLEEYRARVKKLQDPEYAEGLDAKRKLKAREEQDAAESETAIEQTSDEFWQEAQNHYESKLDTFEHLDAEDYPDVVRSFWGSFEAHRNELASQALDGRDPEELTKEERAELVEEVDREALAWLTEEHFEASMKALNDRFARRSGRTGGGKGRRVAAVADEDGDEEAGKAEADRHNTHVNDKLRQRDTRTIKGKGAPPGRTGGGERRPSSWADHMAGIRDEFDKAKKPSVAD